MQSLIPIKWGHIQAIFDGEQNRGFLETCLIFCQVPIRGICCRTPESVWSEG